MDFTKFDDFFKWVGSIWSEDDGRGSSTRVNISVLIAFVVGVGTGFSVLVHKQHLTVDQFNAFLGAGATFLVTVTGALYGINKLADYANNKTAAQNNNGQNPPQEK